jgi:hypothetical protein
LDNQFRTEWVNSMPGQVTTKYEARAKAEGRMCYYFAYRRNTIPAPAVPVMKDLDMPHLVFETPLSLDEMAQQFRPFSHNEGDIHVSYSAVFRGEYTLLFEIHVNEPTIDQHAALLLSKRFGAASEFTLQMASLGHPRPTQGMHVAVSSLGEWLLGLHPDTHIVQQKVKVQ